MADTTYMGDSQSHTCCIGCSWPHYCLGQFFNCHIHLSFEVACLGVLHSGLGHINWFHLGAWSFSLVDDSELVLKIFNLHDSASAPASSSSSSVSHPFPS